ncbi:helicase DnaB [Paenibacillus sabinae]|uniref:Replication initiation and membrane attachment family protein n=1 Tax=Paenibacillus sabinae T27 TaxID=1268072 RepID=X4ZQL0_9BACL|nr:helicase DnaB [Paenibacillus sabinae]AHV98760.1 replication initiation and membrane attachment family protein [Paenibacillus sabinae T27]
MHISHLHHFTEHHRYCVSREFGLSPVDERMLSSIYQPMVGALAISLYRLLYSHVPAEAIGYSPAEPQRRLFLTLGVEPNEKGRRTMIEQASKLEAVGLLQTSRVFIPESEDYMYEYELMTPLSPSDFFATQHLTLLLRDKVGKFAVLSLREQFWGREPEEWSRGAVGKENISRPFYDIFELNTHVIDYELEQALTEVAAVRQPVKNGEGKLEIGYSDIILRFPRESVNRAHVEKLRFDYEQMGVINYVAHKYKLSAQDLCRLLDEDGIFGPDGDVLLDELQHRASQHFRQNMKRQEQREVAAAKVVSIRAAEQAEEPIVPDEQPVEMEYYVEVPPQFLSKCDIHQYNMMLRNEPYTRLLQTFFPGSVPGQLLDIFEKIDLNYKLPGEVINILIHYLMAMVASGGEQRINRNFVEAIASNMLVKQVNSYEKAVRYIRDQSKVKGKAASGAPGARSRSYGKGAGRSGKPEIQIAVDDGQSGAVSEEEFAAMMQMAADIKASKKKGAAKSP